jgi:hypothetical protein
MGTSRTHPASAGRNCVSEITGASVKSAVSPAPISQPIKKRTAVSGSTDGVHEAATLATAPHPAHHVEDRLLPLKQTFRHPLDPPTTFQERGRGRRVRDSAVKPRSGTARGDVLGVAVFVDASH